MKTFNFSNLKSVASALGAITLTMVAVMAISSMFVHAGTLARAQGAATQGAVSVVSALVR